VLVFCSALKGSPDPAGQTPDLAIRCEQDYQT